MLDMMKGPSADGQVARARRPGCSTGGALDGLLADLALLDLWRPRQVGLGAIAALFALIFGAYLHQAATLSLNADDIVQHQSAADVRTMVEAGRWGYAFVWRWLFDYNPAPIFSTALSAGLLLCTALVGAMLLQLRSYWAVLIFVAVSCVSAYYGDLFAFDSTRVAYAAANLFAVFGLWLLLRGRIWSGLPLLVVAPSLYPASVELAATVLLGAGVLHFVGRTRGYSLATLVLSGVGLVAALGLYAVGTRLVYSALGVEGSGRTALDPAALVERLWVLRDLILRHAAPFLNWSEPAYLPPAAVVVIAASAVAYLLWIAMHLRKQGLLQTALAGVGAGLLFLSPFFLLFANGAEGHPARALYAFSTVHALWLASLFDWAADEPQGRRLRRWTGYFALAGAVTLVLASAFQIAKRSYEEQLAFQAEILTANRILGRMETVLAQAGLAADRPVRLAVIVERRRLSGPRGRIDAAGQEAWSKEWIFRLLSRRFLPASTQQQETARQSARARPEWPHPDSVFLSQDGTLVAVIAKASSRAESAPRPISRGSRGD
jgi:hypothetical protein